MQPIGIRPTNDFAFKKTFGSPENKVALISLLNAILTLPVPIVDVTIENPYNLQDFQNDKLSILDIRAVDQRGAIYDVEMQLSTHSKAASADRIGRDCQSDRLERVRGG